MFHSSLFDGFDTPEPVVRVIPCDNNNDDELLGWIDMDLVRLV